jgi:hypothetical protein
LQKIDDLIHFGNVSRAGVTLSSFAGFHLFLFLELVEFSDGTLAELALVALFSSVRLRVLEA